MTTFSSGGSGLTDSGTRCTRRTADPAEGRVTDRGDRQDICDLLVRYATGIDRRDWSLFRTVFTDPCELDYGKIGTWDTVDAVTEFMQRSTATGRRPAPMWT